MAPLYERLIERGTYATDAAALERMKAANAAAIATHDASIQDAREKFGDVEVYERQKLKAEYLTSIGDRAAALAAYDAIDAKTLSTGQRIDMAMAKARLALAFDEWADARAAIAQAKELNETGGDWDRRNRLKVYEALSALVSRDFARAAALLLDSVATFTATELLSYARFVTYCTLAALAASDRRVLKARVVDSPDVLSVIGDVPHLAELLNAFYEGRYADFMRALSDITPALRRDAYVARHATWFVREMRVAAYAQFLEAYKSVTLDGMARAFGLSRAFLDAELARFIAAGRVSAKIDAVAGVVETTRPDAKNAQYHAVLKQGDALLNKIQKLARVVAV